MCKNEEITKNIKNLQQQQINKVKEKELKEVKEKAIKQIKPDATDEEVKKMLATNEDKASRKDSLEMKQKIANAKFADFLSKYGHNLHHSFVKEVLPTKSKEEIERLDLDKNSFITGAALFNEALIVNVRSNYVDQLVDKCFSAVNYSLDMESRALAFIKFFQEMGLMTLSASPLYKILDNESFIYGYIFAAENIFQGILVRDIKQSRKNYHDFILLAQKEINKKD